MRWIKGIDRQPKKEVFIRIEGTKAIGHWSTHHKMFINESGDFFPEDQIEWLDESLPADIEQEAEKLYPNKYKNGEGGAKGSHYMDFEIAEIKRSAHITCARQYMDTIERLKAKIVSLEEELALYRLEK